jgi:hypothetical protein
MSVSRRVHAAEVKRMTFVVSFGDLPVEMRYFQEMRLLLHHK